MDSQSFSDRDVWDQENNNINAELKDRIEDWLNGCKKNDSISPQNKRIVKKTNSLNVIVSKPNYANTKRRFNSQEHAEREKINIDCDSWDISKNQDENKIIKSIEEEFSDKKPQKKSNKRQNKTRKIDKKQEIIHDTSANQENNNINAELKDRIEDWLNGCKKNDSISPQNKRIVKKTNSLNVIVSKPNYANTKRRFNSQEHAEREKINIDCDSWDISKNQDENKIIKSIEEEFSDKKPQKKSNKRQNKTRKIDKKQEIIHDTSANATGWSRMEDLERSIEKQENKYKQLNVENKKPKSKKCLPEKSEKNPTTSLERFESYVNKNIEQNKPEQQMNINDVSLRIKTEPVSSEKINKINNLNKEIEDEVFSLCTQKLQLNQNSEISSIDENSYEIHVVEADIHWNPENPNEIRNIDRLINVENKKPKSKKCLPEKSEKNPTTSLERFESYVNKNIEQNKPEQQMNINDVSLRIKTEPVSSEKINKINNLNKEIEDEVFSLCTQKLQLNQNSEISSIDENSYEIHVVEADIHWNPENPNEIRNIDRLINVENKKPKSKKCLPEKSEKNPTTSLERFESYVNKNIEQNKPEQQMNINDVSLRIKTEPVSSEKINKINNLNKEIEDEVFSLCTQKLQLNQNSEISSIDENSYEIHVVEADIHWNPENPNEIRNIDRLINVENKKPKSKKCLPEKSEKNPTTSLERFESYVNKNIEQNKPEQQMNINDVSLRIKTEPVSSEKINKINNLNKEIEDEVFSLCTQKLQLNQNSEISSIDENSYEIHVVEADIHWNPENPNEIRNINRLVNVENFKEIRDELNNVTETKSAMLTTLKTCLSLTDNIISHYSNSESLFSESWPSQPKASSIHRKSQNNHNFRAFSLPISSQNTSVYFHNTVIPYLKNIKEYYNEINSISLKLINESQPFGNIQKDNEFGTIFAMNDRLQEEHIAVQTDDLICPKCNYAFQLNTDINNTIQNATHSDSEVIVPKKVDRPLQFSPETNILSNLSSNDSKRSVVKRIRSIESDHDSDSSTAKKCRISNFRSKLLYRDDLNIVFESENGTQQENQADKNKKSLDTEDILEREYKRTKFTSNTKVQLLHNSDNDDDIFGNLDMSAFDKENNKKSQFSESLFADTDKIRSKNQNSDSDKNDILSASLFGDSENDCKHSGTVISNTAQQLDIIVAGNQVNTNNDADLDDEVVNFTEDIVYDSLSSDKDSFDDDDNIVESTPQKPLPIRREKYSSTRLPAIVEIEDSNTDLFAIPPPPGFGDNEPKSDTTNITSVTPDILPLNEINMNRVYFEELVANVSSKQAKQIEQNDKKTPQNKRKSSQNKNTSSKKGLKPIVLAQNQKFSPLQIIAKQNPPPKPMLCVTLKQKSILNYVSFSSQTNDENAVNVSKKISNINPDLERPSTSAALKKSKMSQSSSLQNINKTIIKLPVCLTWTRLGSDEVTIIGSLVMKFKIKFSQVFDASVTHVIVSVDDKNRINDLTSKYVLAIAKGLWVVSLAWVRESITHNQLLPEEPYEVLDVSGLPGPKTSRLYRKTNPLFRNFLIHFLDPFHLVDKQECENAIINLGGEIRASQFDLLKRKEKICLILTEYKETQDCRPYQVLREKLKILVVDLEWFSRTIGQYQIVSVRPYLLCSDTGIEQLGYPSELIAEVPDSCTLNATTES